MQDASYAAIITPRFPQASLRPLPFGQHVIFTQLNLAMKPLRTRILLSEVATFIHIKLKRLEIMTIINVEQVDINVLLN
jgi:hypothetical protein